MKSKPLDGMYFLNLKSYFIMYKAIFLWTLMTLFSFAVKGQPVAAFSISQGVGCDSTLVDFMDESTSVEDISTWAWEVVTTGEIFTTQNAESIYYTAGSYMVCLEVSDVLGQMDETCQSFEITIDPMTLDDVMLSHLSCFGGSDGAIDITVSGGAPPYAYVWSNGQATEDISDLAAGIYYLSLSDNSDCYSEHMFEIFEPAELLMNVTVNCASTGIPDGVVNIFVTGGTTPYAYLWDDGYNLPVRENLAPGIYDITVTDVSGCTVAETVLVSEGDFDIEITTTGSFESCEFDPLSFCAEVTNPGPGDVFSYVWYFPNGSVLGTSDCVLIDSLFTNDTGTYTVVITNDNGCTSTHTQDINIIETGGIILSVQANEPLLCGAGATNLEVETVGPFANYTYNWSSPDLLDDPTSRTPVASLLVTAAFTVTVTDIVNGCSTEGYVTVVVDDDCVWPGDTDTNNVVNNFDLLNIGLAYDSIVPIRPGASLAWFGQLNVNGGPIPGTDVDRKHIDCDGDGIISIDDTLGITQNWGLMHQFVGDDDPFELVPDYPGNGSSVTIPFYIEPDTFVENESYALSIILGEEGSEAEDVYGLAFSIEYDPSIIVPGSASIGFDGWIGELEDDMISIQKNNVSPGVIAVGITRIDRMPMTGIGEIGQFFITIEDDILLHGGSDDRSSGLDAVFNIKDVMVINHLGEEISTAPLQTTSIVEETVSANEINWEEYIQIQPNPVDKEFFVTAKNIEIERLSLFSIAGELISDWRPEGLVTTINTSDLIMGTYLLKIQTDLGVVVEKVLVAR